MNKQDIIVSGLKARDILNLPKIFTYFDEIHMIREDVEEGRTDLVYDAIIRDAEKIDISYSSEDIKFLLPFARISWLEGGNRKHVTLPVRCFDYIKIL